MRETRVRFLGWEDPLEKEMAIHSSTLAWKIPRTEEPDTLQSMGLQRVGHDFTFTFLGLGISLPFLVVYSYCIFTLKTLLVIFKNHLKMIWLGMKIPVYFSCRKTPSAKSDSLYDL